MATKKTKQSMRADLAAVDALANKMRRDPKLRAGYEALLAEDDGEAELREMALRQRIETLESELRDRNDVILEAEGDLGVERAKLAYAKETLSLVASALWREGLAAAEHDARRAVPMTRSRVDQMTPAELAIREAMLAVEAAGADERLTQAVCLLHEASAKVYAYALEREKCEVCGHEVRCEDASEPAASAITHGPRGSGHWECVDPATWFASSSESEQQARTVACVVLGEPWSAAVAQGETFGSLRCGPECSPNCDGSTETVGA